ncbi:hypothetical protein ACKWRH_37255 [Bradyrhizobium sp. Pa8]|uniref:hypothetical protein n=1 Tax=Bradyrhizobium sp. Pa8 TaxID=3386552 RepID=UPI00403F45D3
MIVALLSILGVVAPILKEAFSTKAPDVRIVAAGFVTQHMTWERYLNLIGVNPFAHNAPYNAGDDTKRLYADPVTVLGILFVASNNGNAPAIISTAAVEGLGFLPKPFGGAKPVPSPLTSSHMYLVEKSGRYGPITVLPAGVVSFIGYLGPFERVEKNFTAPAMPEVNFSMETVNPDGSSLKLNFKQAVPGVAHPN